MFEKEFPPVLLPLAKNTSPSCIEFALIIPAMYANMFALVESLANCPGFLIAYTFPVGPPLVNVLAFTL